MKPAQCCIKLVFHLSYTIMHGSTKLKMSNVVLCLIQSPKTFFFRFWCCCFGLFTLSPSRCFSVRLINFIRANEIISAPSLSKYPLVFLSWPYTAYVITQSYCAIFHFACGLRREDFLCDTDAACVVFALALCLKKKKNNNSPLDQRRMQTRTQHTKILWLTESWMNKTKTFFFTVGCSIIWWAIRDS